jgi:hypothetical protein
MSNMNIYQKLSAAREIFHTSKLKKTGHNKFANYFYFELGDFLIPALSIFREVGITSVISFEKDIAEMKLINSEKPEDFIVITSPMAEANLKGAHPIQNLGAVETYQRRYLWVTALEIVEHDVLDATTGQTPVKRISATQDVELGEDDKNALEDVVVGMEDLFSQEDIVGVYNEYMKIKDQEQKIYLWSKLDSKIRTAIKKHSASLKGE